MSCSIPPSGPRRPADAGELSTAAALTDLPADRPEAEAAVIATTVRQLRLIFLGVPHWRSVPATDQPRPVDARSGRI